MKLYLGNLPFSATPKDVQDFFDPVHLDRITIVVDRETGRPRGFGFVEIRDAGAAKAAISELDGVDLGGRRIVVSEAVEKRRDGRDRRGGSDGGGDKVRDRPRRSRRDE